MIKHGEVVVNVTSTIRNGNNFTRTNPSTPYQPSVFSHESLYCFDEKFDKGEAFDDIAVLLAQSCMDCSLHVQKKGNSDTTVFDTNYIEITTKFEIKK